MWLAKENTVVNEYFCIIITLLEMCMCYKIVGAVSFGQNKQTAPGDGHAVTGLGKEGRFTILYKDETWWWVLSCTPHFYCVIIITA